jgi:hypothetical protein
VTSLVIATSLLSSGALLLEVTSEEDAVVGALDDEVDVSTVVDGRGSVGPVPPVGPVVTGADVLPVGAGLDVVGL